MIANLIFWISCCRLLDLHMWKGNYPGCPKLHMLGQSAHRRTYTQYSATTKTWDLLKILVRHFYAQHVTILHFRCAGASSTDTHEGLWKQFTSSTQTITFRQSWDDSFYRPAPDPKHLPWCITSHCSALAWQKSGNLTCATTWSWLSFVMLVLWVRTISILRNGYANAFMEDECYFTYPIFVSLPKWWPPSDASGNRRLVHGGVNIQGGSLL